MSVTVDFSPDGSAQLVSDKPVPADSSLSVGLKDLAGDRYLSPTGWVDHRVVLPNATVENGVLKLSLDPAVAAHIETGAKLSLEDSANSVNEEFSWPERPAAAPATPVTEEKSAPDAAATAVDASDSSPPSDGASAAVSSTRRSTAGYGWAAAGVLVGLALGAALFHVYPTDRLLTLAGLPADRSVAEIPDDRVGALEKREVDLKTAEARLVTANTEVERRQAEIAAAKATLEKTTDEAALRQSEEAKRLAAETAELQRQKKELADAKATLEKVSDAAAAQLEAESARVAAASAVIEREKAELSAAKAALDKTAADEAARQAAEAKRLAAENDDLQRQKNELATAKAALDKTDADEATRQTAEAKRLAAENDDLQRQKNELATAKAAFDKTAADEAARQTTDAKRLAAENDDLQRQKKEVADERAKLAKAAEDAKAQTADAARKSSEAADAEIRLTAVRRSLENAQATIRDKDVQLLQSAQRLEEALKKNAATGTGSLPESVLLKTLPTTLAQQLASRGIPELLLDKTRPAAVLTPVPSLLADDGERGLVPVKDSLASQVPQDIAADQNQQLSAALAERDTLKTKSETLQKQVVDLQAQLASSDGANSELRTKIAALEKTAGKAEVAPAQNQKIDALVVERDNLKITAETLRKSVGDLTAQLEGETNINTELRAKVAALEKKASAADVVSSQKEQISALSAERDSLKTASESLQKSVADIKTQLDGATKLNAELRTEIATLTKKTSARGLSVEQQVQISALAAERDNLKTASDELSKSVTEMKTQLDSANSVNAELRNSIAALEKKVAENALVASNETNQRSLDDAELPGLKLQLKKLETTTREQAEKLEQATKQLAARPETRSVWGAVALGQDGLFQTIVNQTSEEAAVDLAMKLCQGQSGDGCSLQQSFNNKCFSLARVSGDRFGDWAWATRPNRETAERAAIASCEKAHETDCSIRISTCTPDSLEK